MQTCVQVLHDPAPPLKSLRSDLPSGLCRAVERCLEKQREHRFGNVGELALALAPYAPTRARSSVERVIRTVSASGGNLLLPESTATALGEEPGVVKTKRAREESTREVAPHRRGKRWLFSASAVALGTSLLLLYWVRPDWFGAAPPRVFQLESEPSMATQPVLEPPRPATEGTTEAPTEGTQETTAERTQEATAESPDEADTTPLAPESLPTPPQPTSSSASPPAAPTPARPHSPRAPPSKKSVLRMPKSPG